MPDYLLTIIADDVPVLHQRNGWPFSHADDYKPVLDRFGIQWRSFSVQETITYDNIISTHSLCGSVREAPCP